MKNNENFRDNLMVGYLDLLAKYGNKEEFISYYQPFEGKLRGLIGSSNDIEELEKINGVLAYRKKTVELEVKK